MGGGGSSSGYGSQGNSSDYLSPEAVQTIENFQEKRADNKIEYGFVLDSKTGEQTSPEYKGGKTTVDIRNSESIRNEETGKWEYKKYEGDTAVHNHPDNGLQIPSPSDVNYIMQSNWADKIVATSKDTIYQVSAGKDKYSFAEGKYIERELTKVIYDTQNRILQDAKDNKIVFNSKKEILEKVNKEVAKEYEKAFNSFDKSYQLSFKRLK